MEEHDFLSLKELTNSVKEFIKIHGKKIKVSDVKDKFCISTDDDSVSWSINFKNLKQSILKRELSTNLDIKNFMNRTDLILNGIIEATETHSGQVAIVDSIDKEGSWATLY